MKLGLLLLYCVGGGILLFLSLNCSSHSKMTDIGQWIKSLCQSFWDYYLEKYYACSKRQTGRCQPIERVIHPRLMRAASIKNLQRSSRKQREIINLIPQLMCSWRRARRLKIPSNRIKVFWSRTRFRCQNQRKLLRANAVCHLVSDACSNAVLKTPAINHFVLGEYWPSIRTMRTDSNLFLNFVKNVK